MSIAAPRQRTAIAWAQDHPAAVVAGFLALHFAALALIALLAQPTLPLDVIEQLAWARDPQFAYFRHPPLPAWVLAALMAASGYRLWLAALAGPAAATLALALVWRLARRVVDPVRAMLAVLMLEGVVYFNFTALEFNHDVIQLPLWALIALMGHRAYREGRLGDWLALGLAAAFGMLGKYSTFLLLVSLLAALLADASSRRRFATKGPWLALAVTVVVLAPHLWAVYRLDFAPFHFPFERAHAGSAWFDRIVFPVGWLAAQFAAIAAALLLGAILAWRRGPAPPGIAEADRRFVLILAFGPAVLSLVLQAVSGLRFRDSWGAPMWDLLGLALVMFGSGRGGRSLGAFFAVWVAVFVAAMGARGVVTTASAYVTGRGERTQFPAHAFADAIEAGWRAQEGGRPLGIAIGDSWLAGLVSAYGRDHPSVMIDGDPAKSPWITRARLDQSGAVLVWPLGPDEAEPAAFAAAFPAARPQPPLSLSYLTGVELPPIRVGWAILPPGR
jgi:hypothetical protein